MQFNITFKTIFEYILKKLVLCIQIRFVSTEKTTRIASRASCLILAISHLLPSTPPYFNFFNNIIIYLRLFNYIYNVENDNALRSHNFSSFFRISIFTSAHTRCSYGYHVVFRSMTVFFMCLVPIFLLTTIV